MDDPFSTSGASARLVDIAFDESAWGRPESVDDAPIAAPSKRLPRSKRSQQAPRSERQRKGIVSLVDIYFESALIKAARIATDTAECEGGFALINIDKRNMERGMWDVLEVGDAVEFNLGPGLRARNARIVVK